MTSPSTRSKGESDERQLSLTNNYHKLGLTEDSLINTQLYGLYNPYNYHSFMNTWNFFFPQDCEVCQKSMYPLMSGACQCLRCGKYVHRQCLIKFKTKCTFFTFDKLMEPSPPTSTASTAAGGGGGKVVVTPPTTNSTTTTANTPTNQKTTLANATSSTTSVSDSGKTITTKKRSSSVVKQIMRKVSVTQLQNAGNLLIGTVTYLPMIAANTLVNSTHSHANTPGGQQKSNHSSSIHSGGGSDHASQSNAIPINKELNSKTEIQLEKIIEKACMIPRMIGYLPEPKSQFCIWTSSLRAIALQQSASFLAYNSSSSSTSSSSSHASSFSSHDNLYLIYYEHLKKKQQAFADNAGNDLDRETETIGRQSMLPRESFTFNSERNHLTSRATLTNAMICEEINFQLEDTSSFYDNNSFDELIDMKFTNLIYNLLDINYIGISFPSQVAFVCIFIFLSMDFTTILENYDNIVLHQQYQSSGFSKLRRNTALNPSSSHQNPYQFALHISNPHYHMIITMQHVRECMDTVISAILSKYDTVELERVYFSQFLNFNNDSQEMTDPSNDFLMLLTRIVERNIFNRYQQAIYDKVFRECMILSSLLQEKYIEQLHNQPGQLLYSPKTKEDRTEYELTINDLEAPPGDVEAEEVEGNAINMVRTPSKSSAHLQEGAPTSQPDVTQPTYSLQNPQFLIIYNEYATKIKQFTSPIDKLKLFVIFLQFLSSTQDQIVIHYPEIKQKDTSPAAVPPPGLEPSEEKPQKQEKSHDDLWNVYFGSHDNLKALNSDNEQTPDATEEVNAYHLMSDEGSISHHPINIEADGEEFEQPRVHQTVSAENNMVIVSKNDEEEPGITVLSSSESQKSLNNVLDDSDTVDFAPREAIVDDAHPTERVSTPEHIVNGTKEDHEKVNEALTVPLIESDIPPSVSLPSLSEHTEKKSTAAPDTDELLEKLTIIMYYQQQNHTIDWIAECIYLSSPILNKQTLAYGIDSYALITLQQAIQLLLTSYYHLQPINTHSSSKNPSDLTRPRLTSFGEKNYYYSHSDENEDYYFWRAFL